MSGNPRLGSRDVETLSAATLALVFFVFFGLTIVHAHVDFSPRKIIEVQYREEILTAFIGEIRATAAQKYAYFIYLFSIAIITIIIYHSGIQSNMLFRHVRDAAARASTAIAVAAIVFVVAYEIIKTDLMARQGGLIHPIGVQYLVAVTLIFMAIRGIDTAGSRAIPKPDTRIQTSVVFIVFLIAFSAIGLGAPISAVGWNLQILTGSEFHFSVTLGVSDRLANALTLFEHVAIGYGVLAPISLALYIKWMGPLEWADYIRIIQILQILMFVGMIVSLLLLYRMRRPSITLLVPCLFVLPDLYSAYNMTWYPNQTAWRYFGLAIALVTLSALKYANPRYVAPILGTSMSLALLWNLEIGIVIAVSYCFYMFLCSSHRSFLLRCADASKLLPASALTIALFWSLFRVSFGYWPVTDVAQIFEPINNSLGGYISLPLKTIDVVALLALFHCTTLVFRAVGSAKYGELTFHTRFKATIAIIYIGWLFYYVNRPQTANLWACLYIYAPLIVDFFHIHRWRGFGDLRPRLNVLAVYPIVVASLILNDMAPAISANRAALAAIMERSSAVVRSETPNLISGVLVRQDIRDALDRKAAYVGRLKVCNSVVPISSHSFLMPILTGVYPKLPHREFFWETVTNANFDNLVTALRKEAPDYVLFEIYDAENPPWGGQFVPQLHRQMQARLSDLYHETTQASGWSVWGRIDGPTTRAHREDCPR